MEQKVNEFRAAVDLVTKCAGTIICGCSMTEIESTDAFILWRVCKKYAEDYNKRFGL